MRIPSPTLRGVLAVAAGAAVLATTACGGQTLSSANHDKSAAPGGAPAAATAKLATAPKEDLAASVINEIQPSTALAASVPDRLRTSGLKVTTSVGYPPMEMVGTDGKTVIGVDASLSRALARVLGVDVSITDQEFNTQIPGLLTGRFDMVLSSMTDNAERRGTVSFVDYVRAGNAFLVQTGNPSAVKMPADVCGKTISVVDNGSSMFLAQDMDKQCKADGKSAVNILKFDGDTEAILTVKSGRAAATITDYPVAVYRAAANQSGLEAVGISGGESPWGIGVDKKDAAFLSLTQKALQELIDSGAYGKILEAWGVQQMAVKSAVVNDGK